ncbi:MAG: alpha/beta fold hydrolase [Granulosicoccus sp.]|nr:alpha/beta fold hydrolase [Granulosicoccus sp.]
MSRLNFQQAGQGPVLVMLHGLFGSLDNFRSVSLHMERTLSVVRMDLPGHGLSPSLPRLSIEAMAEEVLEEVSRLGLREYHLLGHSLGGKVALCMAGHPDAHHLQSLCVVDIAPKQYPPHHQAVLDALQSLDLQTLTDRREADNRLRTAIPDAGVRAFLLKSLFRHESGRFRWRFDLDRLAEDYPLICQPPTISKRIETPALFIKGGSSDYLSAADEPTIKAVCTQPSVKEIEGAGHWPHAEKPAQFTRICLEFLSHV